MAQPLASGSDPARGWISLADLRWISFAVLRWACLADLDLPHRAPGVDLLGRAAVDQIARPATARARPAHGLVAEHLSADGPPAGPPVDAGRGGVTLDEVVGPVRAATDAEDPRRAYAVATACCLSSRPLG